MTMEHQAPEAKAPRTTAQSDAAHAPAAPEAAVPGAPLATLAETLYLCNLLIAPGLAFLAIVWLWRKHHDSAPELARCHLAQAFSVSLWGGGLLAVCSGLFVLAGGLHWEWTWVMVILYFTCVHSTLVMFGVVGLARAMAGQPYVYPLIGRRRY